MGERLAGKVAVITGAGSGIGEATARLFVAEGASVIIADVQDRGRALAEELGRATFIHTDVRSEEQVAAAVNQAVSTYGRLDCMVNNAGFVGAIGSGLAARYTLTEGVSTTALAQFPLLLIPAFAVPLWICLHIAAFVQIRAARAGQPVG